MGNGSGGTGYQSVISSVAGSPLEGRKGYLFCLTPSRQWQFWIGSGEPKAFWRVLGGPQAVPHVWTHLAGTYDRQSLSVTFYVSAEEVGRISGVLYEPNDRNPTRVGAGATEQWGASPCFFCGKVAVVHICDRVLQPAEIQALAAGQSIDLQAERIAQMGSEPHDQGAGTDSITVQRSPAPALPPTDMFGIAGALPLVGGVVGGLPAVGGLLGQGGAAGGAGGQMPTAGAPSAQAVLQLAQLVAQMNVLLVQMTQLLNQMAAAGNMVPGGAIPGMGGAIPGIGGAIAGMGGAIPGMGGAIPGVGNLSPLQLAHLQQLAQLQQQYGLSPQQVAQLQSQILQGGRG